MSRARPLSRPHSARRAGVFRRALRREATRLREPSRIAAMAVLVGVFAVAGAALAARGEAAGADAQAYWAAVRIWLQGGSPYHPTGPFLPYVYAPWMLPLFAPWALLPWDVAWFAWRGGTTLLLLWTIRWAYARRPLPTSILVALLGTSFAANLDTGNVTLPLALGLFGAQFMPPRVAGLVWGLATWMKWVPAPLWLVLAPRARSWGLVFLAISGLLSLALLPLTIVQLQALFGFGNRPIRADYLVLIWSAVPWWWSRREPFAFLHGSVWRTQFARAGSQVAGWRRRFADDPGTASSDARQEVRERLRAFLGLGA